MGGAVRVLKFNARLATRDVDAVILAPYPASHVRVLVARVTERLGWPADWRNDGAKGFVGADVHGKMLFAAPGITVRCPPTPQMLALKLSAWRDDVDIADAEVVLRAMVGAREVLWSEVAAYLPRGQALKAQDAFDPLWEEIQRVTPPDPLQQGRPVPRRQPRLQHGDEGAAPMRAAPSSPASSRPATTVPSWPPARRPRAPPPWRRHLPTFAGAGRPTTRSRRRVGGALA